MSLDEDSASTQRRPALGIEAELEAEGFEHAELIGQGGFGAVYRCVERALERQVAVKVLRVESGTADLARFLREQRTMGKLSGHPNIVTVLHVDVTAAGRPYLVMPYHSRGSLHDALSASGPLPYADGLRLGVKLAGALETAHRSGILHRDVKPGNVLISDYGDPELCDFGIAHITGGFETGTGEVTGSPAFTAPEVLAGRPSTVRSDIYSLGATLFSAVSGHAAFERREGEDLVAQFVRISQEPPELPPDLPDELAALIANAMARRPEERPASAEELGTSIQQLQQNLGLPVDEMGIPVAADISAAPVTLGTPPRTSTARQRTGTTPPTPATRFRPPYPAQALVRRPRLVDMSQLQDRKRLTLIHAPAGFGKSSAATQLAEDLIHNGVRVAWLTVDTDDNNVVTFCAHLIEALNRIEPSLGAELQLALEEAGSRATQFVLTALINEIHERKQQMAIVVDDWDQVTSDSTREAMRFLLNKGCHHLQWIVTTRTKAGLPLGTLRVRHEVIEIDSAALCFNEDEAEALLAQSDGINVAAADVARLTESTEGWVAALQLASLSIQNQGSSATLLTDISGRHQALGEFLAENVLDALDPALVEFMMATSITDRICGGLANALTGDRHGQATLEAVEERNLFLQRLDENGEWYRYYHLFADYLQRRLEREQPERISVLHRSAAHWFADHDMVTDAVTHALAAEDGPWAAELVERTGATLLEQGHMASMLALAEKLPTDAAAARPRLQLIIALTNLGLHKTADARAALDRARTTLDGGQYGAAEQDMRAHCGVVEGIANMLADQSENLDELIAPALANPSAFAPWYSAGAVTVASFIAIAHCDYAAARACRERAAGLLESTAGPFTQAYAYCQSGIAAHEQLDIRATEYYLRKALQVAMTGRTTPGVAARLAGALLGDLLYERNELDEAERLLDAAFEMGATAGAVDFLIALYVTGAKVKAARGNWAEARHRLDAGMDVASELSLPRLAVSIVGERIRLGDTAAADTSTSMPDSAQSADNTRGTRELIRDTMRCNAIRHSLAEQPESLDATIEEARSHIAELEGRHRSRALLTARLLLAQCLSMSGQDLPARRTVSEIVDQCAELGLIRPILDAGPRIWSIVESLEITPRTGAEGAATSPSKSLLAAITAARAANPA